MADMKEIKFKALMDMSDFDTGIQKVQARLKQISATEQRIIGQGTAQGGGGLTPQAQAQMERFQEKAKRYAELESKRLDEDIKKEQERTKELERRLKIAQDAQAKNIDNADKLEKAKKLELEILEKQLKIESDIVKRKELQKELAEKTGKIEGGAEAEGGGGISGLIDRTIKKINPQMIAKLFSGVATGLSMYAGYLGIQKTRDRELLAARGQAVSNLNVGFQDAMQGRGFMSFFEQDERRNALTMALQEREKRLQLDPIRALGSGLTKAIGGGLAGGFATGGNPFGIAAGVLAGGGSELLNKNTFKMIADPKAYQADVTAEMAKNFKANLAARRAINYEKFAGAEQFEKRFGNLQNIQRRLQLSDEELLGRGRYEIFGESSERTGVGAAPERKMKNVRKGRGAVMLPSESEEEFRERQKEYNDRMGKMEAIFNQRTRGQRTREGMGFMRSSLYDRAAFDEHGNLKSGASASFTEERIRANMQSMFQAGAGSEFMRGGGATMAAEYQRAGFLNAAPELGMLAGFGGGAKTEQAYLKLLSEAVRVGFNTSEPSEDLRRFVGAATNLFTQTEGAEGAVTMLGQSMAGTSFQDLKAAQNAYGILSGIEGQSTGMRGALKQSFLVSKKGKELFKGVSSNVKQLLTEVKDIDLDHPLIEQAAMEMAEAEGKDLDTMTDEELMEYKEKAARGTKEMQMFSREITNRQTQKRLKAEKFLSSGIKGYKKSLGKKADTMTEEDIKRGFERRAQKLTTDYTTSLGISESGWGGLGAETFEALGKGGVASAKDFMASLVAKGKEIDLKGKGTITDKTEASKAEDQVKQLITVNRNLSNLLSSYKQNSQRSYEELIKINTVMAGIEALNTKGKIDEDAMKELMNLFSGNSRGNFVEIKQPNTKSNNK